MKKDISIPGETLQLYEKLIVTNKKVERKGATMPYTSCKGHMFSFLSKDGSVNLRLPAEDLQAFIKKYKTTQSFQNGVVMKEYAVVPRALLKKTAELKKYFDVSYKYVQSLKPK
ncbi:MAG TPA: hypothetical protein VN026_12760 [Bacteroidia bacterium]|jgi:hypothetical protein|nr:hypothetical protein [Bacteroidia bacterium]